MLVFLTYIVVILVRAGHRRRASLNSKSETERN